MASSADPWVKLGAFFTGTEARQLADRLEDGDPLSAALTVVASGRRSEARGLLADPGTGHGPVLIAALRALQGAATLNGDVQPVWTMPDALADTSGLTLATAQLVRAARASVTCSTYNFQQSSALWGALAEVAARPEVSVRVYVDGTINADGAIAAQLPGARVLRSRSMNGSVIRNHAKFVVVDHRFVLVTSANYSWSAENRNVELGLRVDDPGVAGAIEEQLLRAEELLYEPAD